MKQLQALEYAQSKRCFLKMKKARGKAATWLDIHNAPTFSDIPAGSLQGWPKPVQGERAGAAGLGCWSPLASKPF